MKILFFNYEYPPLGGGAGNAASYILREFSKIQDLEVDLITSSIDSDYHLERIGETVKIHRLPIGKNKSNFHYQSQKDLIVYAWKAYFFSRKLLRQNRYDLTHSFFAVPCGFLSLLIKWQHRIPYIVSLRGADVPGYSERFPFVYKFLTPIIKLIWKKAASVVANSEGLKNLALKSRPGQKIEVIYNGVDTEEFKPDSSGRFTDDAFRIICVSRLTGRKGIKYLVQAVSLLVKQYPRIKLKIIGKGDLEQKLKELTRELGLEKSVEFAGLVEHGALPDYYSQSHVFVLPSLNEGMSNTMLEAAASGLPLIATNTGGSGELVKDGENGFIVEMKNSEDIAQKIEKIITNEKLQEKMSQKSREIALKMSWKKVAEEYFKMYKQI